MIGRELKILAKEGLALLWEGATYAVLIVALLVLVIPGAIVLVAVDLIRKWRRGW